MKISIAVAAAILGCAFASPRHVRIFERSLQGSLSTSTPMTTISVTGSETNPATFTNDALIGSVDLAFNHDASNDDDPIGSDDPSGTSADADDPTGDDPVDVSSEDTDVSAARSGNTTGTFADSNDLSDDPDGVTSEDMTDTTNDDPVGFDDPTGTSADSDDPTYDNQTASNLVGASANLKASTTISSKAISPANKAIFSGVASASVLVGVIALI